MRSAVLLDRTRRWFIRSLFNLSGLILVYAILDFVLTWLRVQELVRSALADRIIIISPVRLMGDSMILLVAAIALKIGARWGLLTSFVGGCLILYRGLEKLFDMAVIENLPVWSVATFRSWRTIGHGNWDFPRLLVAALIVIYVLVTALRRIRASTGERGEESAPIRSDG